MADKQYKRGKTTNKPAVTKRMPTRESAGEDFSFASSPRFKELTKRVQNGELTTSEAIDMLVPKNLKGEERDKIRIKLAQVMGSQSGKERVANTYQKVNEKVNKNKTQTRKPSYNKGGYANCGASMKATQKSTKMAYGGMARKK
jgi:hypothetical protein